MRALRAAFNLAPKSEDAEYDDRKRALTSLHDALEDYKSAMDKVKISVEKAAASLIKAKAAFEAIAESEGIPSTTSALVSQFGSAVDRINGKYISAYSDSMERDVVPAVLNLEKLADECEHYMSIRNKALREYDVIRQDVAKKEHSAAKKGRDLSTSRSYSMDIVKRDDLKSRFDQEDAQFKNCHEYILGESGPTLNRCLATFFACSASYCGSVAQEFEVLLETARELEQPSHQESGDQNLTDAENDSAYDDS